MSVFLIIADRDHEKQVALARGLSLADKLGYVVQVVGFCYESLRSAGIVDARRQATAKRKLLTRRKRELEVQIKKFKPRGLKVSCVVEWQKDIHRWIDRRCAKKSYAAVIKTGHRNESFIYTSTDWHLLRSCPAPVMIAAEKKWRATKPIMAAIDVGSKSRSKQRLNQQLIATAKHYSEALGCALHLVHALHIPAVLRELDLVDEHSYVRQLRRELQPKLAQLSKVHAIPLSQFCLKQGPVDKVITSEAARLRAQLVVMGTVGRGGVSARLMGNTAEQVLCRLRTDVLALKP